VHFKFYLTYLNSLTDSIILNNIARRYKIRKIDVLKRILKFLYKNICFITSFWSIKKELEKDVWSISYDIVDKYTNYLENAFLTIKTQIFSFRTKNILQWYYKFYSYDTGILNSYTNSFDIEKNLENLIFLEILRRNWKPISIKTPNFEIDFFDENNKIYYQITYSIKNQKTFERETKWLLNLKDSYPKYILTLDEIEKDYKWIKIINIIDFLINTNL